MTRVTYFVLICTLIAPHSLTVIAQDDTATPPKATSGPAVRITDDGTVVIDANESTYKQLDANARQLAQRVRQLQKVEHLQNPKPPRLKAELRKTVAAAFESRQQLQRVELAELRQRLARIQKLIDTRERIKDKIIDRRVEELLTPELRWPSDEVADVHDPTDVSVAGASGAPSAFLRRLSPTAVKQIGSSASQLDSQPGPQVRAQVRFDRPAKATVMMTLAGDKRYTMPIPGWLPITTGRTVYFSLSNIPEWEGLALAGSIELASASEHTRPYLAHNAIPLEISNEDVEQATSGKLITKVIYLPNAANAELAIAGVETLVTTRLDPGVDPIEEAKRRGAILIVLRLGNRTDPPNAGLNPIQGDSPAVADPSHPARPRDVDQEAKDIIPRWERWQVRWTMTSLEDYARQLDYFKVELGAAGGGKRLLYYASNLSSARPDTRQGAGPDEKRLYMAWKGGKQREFDEAILAKAGIPTAKRLLLHFYSDVLEDSLAYAEKEHADSLGHKSVKEYLKTTFGVRPKGNNFEIYVEEQKFRPAPR